MSSSSIINREITNKPKAKQKERIRVGIRGAPKEKVQIKTKIVNKLDEGIVLTEKITLKI